MKSKLELVVCEWSAVILSAFALERRMEKMRTMKRRVGLFSKGPLHAFPEEGNAVRLFGESAWLSMDSFS
jgi:hypothetical protein